MAALKTVTLEVHEIRPTMISYEYFPATDEVELNAAYIGVGANGQPVNGALQQCTVHWRGKRTDIPKNPRDGLTYVWNFVRDTAITQELNNG